MEIENESKMGMELENSNEKKIWYELEKPTPNEMEIKI